MELRMESCTYSYLLPFPCSDIWEKLTQVSQGKEEGELWVCVGPLVHSYGMGHNIGLYFFWLTNAWWTKVWFISLQILDEVEKRREMSPALVHPFMRSVMEAPFPAPGRTITVKSFLPGAGNEVTEFRTGFPVLTGVCGAVAFCKLHCRVMLSVNHWSDGNFQTDKRLSEKPVSCWTTQ